MFAVFAPYQSLERTVKTTAAACDSPAVMMRRLVGTQRAPPEVSAHDFGRRFSAAPQLHP